jgi:6-pyruvoyltetrahydropterin/6-carboxytetrahydropterin synthase
MFELSKSFRFEAAHTLQRAIGTEGSRRVHGHSYRAEVTVRGVPDQDSGMIVDLGLFDLSLQKVRDGLDHHFLDDVQGLGPATLENLAVWIWQALVENGVKPAHVTVARDSSGESCRYTGPVDG